MHEALARLRARPIAHRGLHACGAPEPVENSIGSAMAAVAAAYGIECDIRLSRDREAMVFHDEGLERLTAAAGPVAAHDAATLATLTLRGSGDRMPTLAAFLAAIDGRVPLVIEIKPAAGGDIRLAARAIDLVRGYPGAVALESFDPLVVAYCLRHAPCPVGLVGPVDGAPADPALVERCDFLSWSIDELPAVAARHPGVPLTTWTVRTPEGQALAWRHDAQIVFEGFDPVTTR